MGVLTGLATLFLAAGTGWPGVWAETTLMPRKSPVARIKNRLMLLYYVYVFQVDHIQYRSGEFTVQLLKEFHRLFIYLLDDMRRGKYRNRPIHITHQFLAVGKIIQRRPFQENIVEL